MFIRPLGFRTPLGGYQATAVNVNSGDAAPYYFQKASGFAGSDSTLLTVATWVRRRASDTNVNAIFTDESWAEMLLDNWADGATDNKVVVEFRDSANNGMTQRTASTTFSTHGIGWDQWLCFLWSINFSGNPSVSKLWCCGPGIADTNILSITEAAGPITMDLNRATQLYMHRTSGTLPDLVVSYSDTTWNQGTALNFDTESERRKFVTADGLPVDPGVDGSGCWGFQPHSFMLGGDYSNNIGSGADWTAVGTIPAAPDAPGS